MHDRHGLHPRLPAGTGGDPAHGRAAARAASGRKPWIAPLYGNLSQKEQDQAIRPAPAGQRKIVLATSIAETSITIDGVRIVIDSGLQRLPVFEPSTGITRLETVRVSARLGRPARRPRGANRTRHRDPPLASGPDGGAAGLHAAANPGERPFRPGARPRPLGRSGPEGACLSRSSRRGRRSPRREALLAQLGALDRQGGLTREGKLMRELALAAAACGHGDLGRARGSAGEAGAARGAADRTGARRQRASISTNGCGGSRNERGERADAARQLARPDRLEPAEGDRRVDGNGSGRTACCCMPIPTGSRCSAAGAGASSMANGRGAELPETERLAGSADAGHRRPDRPGGAGAHPGGGGNQPRGCRRQSLPDAIRTSDECVFDRASRQVRARRGHAARRHHLRGNAAAPPDRRSRRHGALGGGRAGAGASDRCPFPRKAQQLRERIGFLHRSDRRALAGYQRRSAACDGSTTGSFRSRTDARGLPILSIPAVFRTG